MTSLKAKTTYKIVMRHGVWYWPITWTKYQQLLRKESATRIAALTFFHRSLALCQAAEPTWLITSLTLSPISLSVATFFGDFLKAFDRAVREAVMGYQSHIGSDPICRRAEFGSVGFQPLVGREVLRMQAEPLSPTTHTHTGACHCTLDPGSVMVLVRRSLRYDKAADMGASWRAQSSSFCTLKHLCGYKTGLLHEGCVARVVCPNRPFHPEKR